MANRIALASLDPAATDKDAPAAIRVGDHPALDFLNTIAAPRGVTIEWLADGRALLNWLVASAALPDAEAKRIESAVSVRSLDRAASQARELREWFRDVVSRVKSDGLKSLSAADLKYLNGALAAGAAFQRIQRAGDPRALSLTTLDRWARPGGLLVPIATSMAELLCTADFELVRRCENPPCTIWFYDRTKGHRRRWCSQAVCGNRMKVAAHRKRKRLVTGGPRQR